MITDAHVGFSRYSKVNPSGVNTRESDFYRAYITAIQNLLEAGVEALVDLGDIADNPHPRKRAVHCLVETISAAGIPYFAIEGNHTKVRHSTDTSLLYHLSQLCHNFKPFWEPTHIPWLNAVLIPYGASDEIKAGLELADQHPEAWIGGHWACDDVLPDGHDITSGDLPANRPILLGHFHGRVGNQTPTYIGATERKAWGEATNPTGAAVYDTENRQLTFIDHKTRDWIDLTATPQDYLDVVEGAMDGRDDQPIVRLTIAATREEYRNVDELATHRLAANALDLTIRRQPTDEEVAAPDEPVAFALSDDWRQQVKAASIPKGVRRKDVEAAGVDALAAAGVAA